MKNTTLIVLLASAASLGFVGWRVCAVHKQTVNHYALIGDASQSYTGGCASIVGLSEEELHTARVSQGSTLTVLMTGDAGSADEPRELARYVIPASRKRFRGECRACV